MPRFAAGRLDVEVRAARSAPSSSSSITGVVRNVRWSQLQTLTVAPANGSLAAVPPTSARASSEQRPQSGPGQVGGRHQPVVPGADRRSRRSRCRRHARHCGRPARAPIVVPTGPSCVASVPCQRASDRLLADLRAPDVERLDRRREHPRPAARRHRAARPAPAVQHRPGDRRARWPAPRSSGSATRSTSGCCRRWPTRSPTSTRGRPARSGCRRRRCSRCSTTSAGASRRRRPAGSCSSTVTAATARCSASPTASCGCTTG